MSRAIVGRNQLQGAIKECSEAVKTGASPMALHTVLTALSWEERLREVLDWDEPERSVSLCRSTAVTFRRVACNRFHSLHLA